MIAYISIIMNCGHNRTCNINEARTLNIIGLIIFIHSQMEVIESLLMKVYLY